MFTVVGKKITESDAMIIIEPNLNGNKVSPKNKTPLSDLNARIRSRLQSIGLKKKNASEITFREFSIDRLDFIRKIYKRDTEIKDIFNLLSKSKYDPECVVLEEASLADKSDISTKDVKFSENDFKFVITSLLDRVDSTENFKSLVLRNFDQKYLEALGNIKFPDRLKLRIEHADKNILEKLQSIKLQAKVDFFISNSRVTDKKSKKNCKSKTVFNSSNKPECISDIKTAEEASASESDHDSNLENIIRNGEKDSSELSGDNSYLKIGSVGPINQVTNNSLLNQSEINVIPDTEVFNASDTLLDIFTIIKTVVSDAETTQQFPNDTIPQSLKLINFVASATLAEAEYVRNTRELKKQIKTLNEQIQTKAVDQEKVCALQEEINILKQDKTHLQADLANIVSGNQSKLVQYVLETSQLREKNQQLVHEVEDLKTKLSKQESSNKRKLAEEEGYISNKVRRVEEQYSVHNNNPSQNSPVTSYNYSRPISNGSQFFSSPSTTARPNIYSSITQELPNNNGVQPFSIQVLDTSSSNHSSPPHNFSNRNRQIPRK